MATNNEIVEKINGIAQKFKTTEIFRLFHSEVPTEISLFLKILWMLPYHSLVILKQSLHTLIKLLIKLNQLFIALLKV